MKMTKTHLFIFLVILMSGLVSNHPEAWAEPSAGEPAAVPVATAVHGAADAASLFDEFNAVMDQYDRETSPARKKELLEKAKNILARLIDQAKSVESEVSVLTKKRLDKIYVKKLNRVLSRVAQMRNEAQQRMLAAKKTG
jgi:hypothetical protein